ncbi:hypothetical protein D3C86_1889660 [compost metagenome]
MKMTLIVALWKFSHTSIKTNQHLGLKFVSIYSNQMGDFPFRLYLLMPVSYFIYYEKMLTAVQQLQK